LAADRRYTTSAANATRTRQHLILLDLVAHLANHCAFDHAWRNAERARQIHYHRRARQECFGDHFFWLDTFALAHQHLAGAWQAALDTGHGAGDQWGSASRDVERHNVA